MVVVGLNGSKMTDYCQVLGFGHPVQRIHAVQRRIFSKV